MSDCSTIRFPELLPALYRRAAQRIPPEDVDDVVQETLLAAWESRSQYRGQAAPSTWVGAILRHKVADYYRDRERRPVTMCGAGQDAIPVPVDDNRIRTTLHLVLDTLPPSYRAILWLRACDLKFSEVACVLGISLDAAKSRYRRAISRLAEEWCA